MGFGDMFRMAMGYWYIILPLLGILVAVAVGLFWWRLRKRKKEAPLKYVNAIIYGKRRQVVQRVPQGQIEGFDNMLPRYHKGKKVYLLEVIEKGKEDHG